MMALKFPLIISPYYSSIEKWVMYLSGGLVCACALVVLSETIICTWCVTCREALAKSVLSMELPIMKKVWTFYPVAGFLFGRLALAIALLYAMLTWLPLSWVHRFLAVLPDSCCRFLVSRTIWQLVNEKDDENTSQEYDKRLEHNMSGPLLQTSFGNVNSSSDIHR